MSNARLVVGGIPCDPPMRGICSHYLGRSLGGDPGRRTFLIARGNLFMHRSRYQTVTKHLARGFAALLIFSGAFWMAASCNHSTSPSESAPARNSAAGASGFEIRWAGTPISLDGKLDEPAWKSAQLIDQFHLPWLKEKDRPAKSATRARLLWDRQYLYFGADMDDADLIATVKEHNGMLWMKDVFEIFLKPTLDKPSYYEFEFNPLNAVFDMYIPDRKLGGFKEFINATKFHIETQVAIRGTLNDPSDTDKGWTVEGRIPWTDFLPTGGRPNPGDQWTFTLCRVDEHGDPVPQELSTVAPLTQRNFHLIADYAPVRFVGPPKTGALPNYTPFARSRVVGFPDPPPPFTVRRAFPNLDIYQPNYIAAEPGTNRLVVIQHLTHWGGPAKIIRFDNNESVSSAEPILEKNFLVYGMTFHPNYLKNGYVYLISNGPVDAKGEDKKDRISRYTVDVKNGHKWDPNSEVVILEW